MTAHGTAMTGVWIGPTVDGPVSIIDVWKLRSSAKTMGTAIMGRPVSTGLAQKSHIIKSVLAEYVNEEWWLW